MSGLNCTQVSAKWAQSMYWAHAQLAVIPDAGHFVLYEDPEKLLPLVACFLDQPASTVPFATPISGYHPGETR